jgi:hypothetical protein
MFAVMAVCLGLAAAAAFGAASVLEERSTKQVPERTALSPPLVSIGVGAAFLHEKIAAAPPDLAAEGLCLAITIGGIIALARRAPHVAQVLDSPRTAEPALAVGSTACARPRAAKEQLTKVWRPALAVPPARSGLSPHGADAAQCVVLIAFHRHVAHADNATTRPCCSTGTRRTECPRIPQAA